MVNLLSTCLNKWSIGNGRGIPQGLSPSDILGKVYLHNVDVAMCNAGFDFIRYVDDIRIFCRDEVEAKKALLELMRLTRRRGLNLQSAKTKILNASHARANFDSVTGILTNVEREFIRKVREEFEYGEPYLTLADADRLASANPGETTSELLTATFDANFNHENTEFNPPYSPKGPEMTGARRILT